jgi:hypothetical protein
MHVLVNEWPDHAPSGSIARMKFRRHAFSDTVLIANCPLLNSALNIRNRNKSQMKKSQLLFGYVPRPFAVICKRLNISHCLMKLKLT